MILEEAALSYFRGRSWDSAFLRAGKQSGGNVSSRRIGRNRNFEDYRIYQPGDDIRDIDWKVFARTDRLSIRNYGSDNTAEVRLILDASLSMNYPDDGQSKFNFMIQLAALTAWLFLKKHHQVRLSVAGDSSDYKLTLNNLEKIFESIKPYGKLSGFPIPGNLSENRFFISDGWWKSAVGLQQDLLNQKIHFWQILSPPEITFDLTGSINLTDIEIKTSIPVIASEVREKYQKLIQQKCSSFQKEWSRYRLLYHFFSTDIPYFVTLEKFLRTAHV